MPEQKPADYIPPDHRLPPAEEDHHGRRKLWYWILGLIIVAGILYWVFHRHANQAGGASATASRAALGGPVTITTVTAKKGDIGVYLEAIGTVTALYTDSITAQVTGVITAVHYREGQLVRKGDPLIDIDPRQYQALVTESEGALERDQNLLAQAEMDLARYQEAWAKNAIQRQTVEDQEKVVLQDKGTVRNDQGTLRYNQVQLGYCHIVAPISGRIGLRLVDPGNLVTANSTISLVVITETQPITVVATISEDNLPEVMAQNHGLNLPLEAWGRTDNKKIATGRVISYDNQIDTTTGTLKLRSLFQNPRGQLYPNEFVNTRLLVKTMHDQILLPDSAIQHNGTEAFVYLIQDSKAVMHDVKVGVTNEGTTAVQGINVGDTVADSGFQRLQSGSKVTISSQPIPNLSNEANTP